MNSPAPMTTGSSKSLVVACTGAQLVSIVALASAVACQSAPSGPVSVPLADAASIHIYAVPTNADWTSHIPLTVGYTVRMKIRLYTADGREISPLMHPLEIALSFRPTTLATATVADSALLLFDATPTDSAGKAGGLTVTLTEPATATTKSFGEFYVLIHPSS